MVPYEMELRMMIIQADLDAEAEANKPKNPHGF